MESLFVGSTPLAQLDIKNGASLKHLELREVELEVLDASGCPGLQFLDCSRSKLKSIDVSACPLLTRLSCPDNQLTGLDVSSCIMLETINCSGNQLTDLDLTANTLFKENTLLKEVSCANNQIEKLDISTCSGLWSLDIRNNCITDMDLSNNTGLTAIHAANNRLASVNLKACKKLSILLLENNCLKSIDLTKLKELRTLDVSCNQLASLDVSKNKKLEELNYYDNKIKTKTDLSNCKKLCMVRAYGNKKQTTAASVEEISIQENENGGIICKWGKVKCDGYNVYVTPYDKTFYTKKTSTVIAGCFLIKGENTVEVISHKKIGNITYYGRPFKKTYTHDPAVKAQAEVMEQKGTLEGMATIGGMQGLKGNKAVQWRWEKDVNAKHNLNGYRSLWGVEDSPVHSRTYIENKLAAGVTSVAGTWEKEDGTLYLLCRNKKQNVLTYIVAKKNGKVLRGGSIDFAKYYKKKHGKTFKRLYIYEMGGIDKKGRIVALYYANGERGMLAIQTKTGKITGKKLKTGNWYLQDDGTPLLLPDYNLVTIYEGSEQFEIYACHGKTLYKIDMAGDIYKGTTDDVNNLEKISTGSIYTADPAITDDIELIDQEYFLSDCCVSGDGKKLYVRYWKGTDDCFEDKDEVFYMVSYKLE